MTIFFWFTATALSDLSGDDSFGAIRFYASPTDGATADGFFHRAEQDDIHELAIVEALEQDRDEESPVFVWLK